MGVLPPPRVWVERPDPAGAPTAASRERESNAAPFPWEAHAGGPSVFESVPSLIQSYGSVLRRFFTRWRRSNSSGRRGRRRRVVSNAQAGRNIQLVPYRPAENLLAPAPTLLEALKDGRFRPGEAPRFRRSELRGWAKVERESLTLVLLVDVSRSCLPHLRAIADLLQSMAGHFHRNRDRMGLIAIQGRQSRLLHFPTHNYRVVTRHLARLQFGGETPLADGLRKALITARRERIKNPGSQSLVVLLSDCCPEPLVGGFDEVLDEPAYREARAAARMYRRERVGFLLLLPAAPPAPVPVRRDPLPGDRLAEALVASARGRLLPLPRSEGARLGRKQSDMVLSAIESMFGMGSRAAADRGGAAGTGFGAGA